MPGQFWGFLFPLRVSLQVWFYSSYLQILTGSQWYCRWLLSLGSSHFSRWVHISLVVTCKISEGPGLSTHSSRPEITLTSLGASQTEGVNPHANPCERRLALWTPLGHFLGTSYSESGPETATSPGCLPFQWLDWRRYELFQSHGTGKFAHDGASPQTWLSHIGPFNNLGKQIRSLSKEEFSTDNFHGIWAFQGCGKGEWGKDREADRPRQWCWPSQLWREASNWLLSSQSLCTWALVSPSATQIFSTVHPLLTCTTGWFQARTSPQASAVFTWLHTEEFSIHPETRRNYFMNDSKKFS